MRREWTLWRLKFVPVSCVSILSPDLELLPKLKLKTLYVVPGLAVQRLGHADFERSHGGYPGNGDTGRITQALLLRSYPARSPDRASIQKRAEAYCAVIPHAGHRK